MSTYFLAGTEATGLDTGSWIVTCDFDGSGTFGRGNPSSLISSLFSRSHRFRAGRGYLIRKPSVGLVGVLNAL
jgi:hypothetical protein